MLCSQHTQEVTEWKLCASGYSLGDNWTQPVSAESIIAPVVLNLQANGFYQPSPNTIKLIRDFESEECDHSEDDSEDDSGNSNTGSEAISNDDDEEETLCLDDITEISGRRVAAHDCTAFEYQVHVNGTYGEQVIWKQLPNTYEYKLSYDRMVDQRNSETNARRRKTQPNLKISG